MASARTGRIPAAQRELARAGPGAGQPAVPARWTLLAATAGFGGAVALGASFGLLPHPPPPTATVAELTHYAAAHPHVMLAAAWLEGTGTLLQVAFVLALAHLAGARAGLAGKIITVACATVLGVSLIYDVMLIAIALSATLGAPQTTTAVVAYGLFAAVEHVFVIALPLLLPLGLILLRTPLLPRAFATPSTSLAICTTVAGRVWNRTGLPPVISTTAAITRTRHASQPRTNPRPFFVPSSVPRIKMNPDRRNGCRAMPRPRRARSATTSHLPSGRSGSRNLGSRAFRASRRTGSRSRRSIILPSGGDPIAVAAAMTPAMSSWIALRQRVQFRTGQNIFVLGATGNAGQVAVDARPVQLADVEQAWADAAHATQRIVLTPRP